MKDESSLSTLDGFANETLAGRIADQLKRQIVTGQLRPGQKLVEKEIAALYNVSRTPLREALARLVNDGLAISVPYRGIFVRRIGLRQARDIYELRIGVEGLAAMLAAERGSTADFDRMSTLLGTMDEQLTGDDAADLKLLNERFHRAIAEASGNTLLVQRHDELWRWVALARTSAWANSDRGEISRTEHHALYRAIRARDGTAARTLAEDHIRRAWATVEPALARQEAADEGLP